MVEVVLVEGLRPRYKNTLFNGKGLHWKCYLSKTLQVLFGKLLKVKVL